MVKKKWQKFEKEIAQDFNAKVNKGSGNQWYLPSDVKNDIYLIECKHTEQNSYSLKWETLDKIYEEALFSRRIPLMAICIEPPKKEKQELIIMWKDDFEKLIKD